MADAPAHRETKTGLDLSKAKMLALVMLEQGHTYERVIEATGLCRGTIAAVSRGRDAYTGDVATYMRGQEADKLTYLIGGILESIDDKDINAASLNQKAIAVGIFKDKRDGIDINIQGGWERKLSDEELAVEIERLKEEALNQGAILAQYEEVTDTEEPREDDTPTDRGA